MSDAIPTVTIETKNGPCDINECDFDPAKHTKYGAKPAAKPSKKFNKPRKK
jgi:hypothetical protein